MTQKQIVQMLKSYSPSQADVIHEMAAERGLERKKLLAADYRALLREEAEFSIEAAMFNDPREVLDGLIYSADLLAMAEAI